ncbi:hypothetical protein ACSAZL_01130 [Methanosarcina sp. T3]
MAALFRECCKKCKGYAHNSVNHGVGCYGCHNDCEACKSECKKLIPGGF